jgi:arylsulfatase A-like enzyme
VLRHGRGGVRGSTPQERLARLRANWLVVVLDAGSARHVGTYGYHRETTPTVDALAADGVVFERAYRREAVTASRRR